MKELAYISPCEINLKDNKASIELLPAGEWLHPDAPDGKLVVKEKLLDEFIANFKDKIVGSELPIDFRHEGETATGIPYVGGWIVDMVKKVDELGRKAIYAVLNITDSEVMQRIKEKSLRYISPQIKLDYENPENGKLYNIIRAASLTNWPYIKNMAPASPINFEEIQKKEVTTMDRFKELEGKKILTFTEFEEYRELLNNEQELDAEEVAFKLKEAFEKSINTKEDTSDLDAQWIASFASGLPESLKKDGKPDIGLVRNAIGKLNQMKNAPGDKVASIRAMLQSIIDKDVKTTDKEKGGDLKMTEELKAKVEELTIKLQESDKKADASTAATFALQEKLRAEGVEKELSSLISSGRMTPAMGKLAGKIMLAGEPVKTKVTISLEEGKTEEKETNLKELFTQFVQAMPKEWKVNMEQELKKGVVLDEKIELREGDIDKMSPEEYEKHRDTILKKAEEAAKQTG